MSDTRRQQLLDNLFGKSPRPASQQGALDPALMSRIIAGLIFGQRPILAASEPINAEFNLGPRGAFMLSLISNGVLYPNDLATVLRIGRSLVTAELSRLSEAGLIAAEPGDDRRRTRLRLTPSGMRTHEGFRAAIVGRIERKLARYTPEQVELFATMLLQMQTDQV